MDDLIPLIQSYSIQPLSPMCRAWRDSINKHNHYIMRLINTQYPHQHLQGSLSLIIHAQDILLLKMIAYEYCRYLPINWNLLHDIASSHVRPIVRHRRKPIPNPDDDRWYKIGFIYGPSIISLEQFKQNIISIGLSKPGKIYCYKASTYDIMRDNINYILSTLIYHKHTDIADYFYNEYCKNVESLTRRSSIYLDIYLYRRGIYTLSEDIQSIISDDPSLYSWSRGHIEQYCHIILQYDAYRVAMPFMHYIIYDKKNKYSIRFLHGKILTYILKIDKSGILEIICGGNHSADISDTLFNLLPQPKAITILIAQVALRNGYPSILEKCRDYIEEAIEVMKDPVENPYSKMYVAKMIA